MSHSIFFFLLWHRGVYRKRNGNRWLVRRDYSATVFRSTEKNVIWTGEKCVWYCDRARPTNSNLSSVWASRSENSNCDQNTSARWTRIEPISTIHTHCHHTGINSYLFRLNSKTLRTYDRGIAAVHVLVCTYVLSTFFSLSCIPNRVNDSQYTQYTNIRESALYFHIS